MGCSIVKCTAPYNEVLGKCRMEHLTVLWIAALVMCCDIQCSAVECSAVYTVPRSAVLCSKVQWNAVLVKCVVEHRIEK